MLDTLFVAPRCCVHLISVQDQLVLVGRDASGMKEIVPIRAAFDRNLVEAARHGLDLERLETENSPNRGAEQWPVANPMTVSQLEAPIEALRLATESSLFDGLAPPLQIALFMGALAFLTSILVSVTSFTRIVIVLSFVRPRT